MAHNNYFLDLCVDVFVVHEGAVLLRLHDKYNYWGAPGGHVDAGEDLNEAALREVWEEVGLRVELIGPPGWVRYETEHNRDLVPPMFINRHKINDVHEHSCCIFIAKAESRNIEPQSESDVHAAVLCMWVTKEELEDLKRSDKRMSDDNYRYALHALERVAQI